MEIRDKYKYHRVIAMLAIICALLQLMFAPHIHILGGALNFMMILTVSVALIGGSRYGCCTGFFAGLFYDLTTSSPMGLMMLLLTVIGFVLGSSERNRVVEQIVDAIKMTFAVSIASNMLYGIALLMLHVEHSFVQAVFIHGLMTGVITALFAIPFMFILSRTDMGQGFAGRAGGTRFRSIR